MRQFHEVVKETISGKAEGLATELGKSTSTIFKWAEDPEGSGSPIPGNLIFPLCKAAGDNRMVEYLAQRLNLVVLKIPECADKNGNYDYLAELSHSFGESVKSVGQVLRDGRVTNGEMDRLDAALHALITQAFATMEYFRLQSRKK